MPETYIQYAAGYQKDNIDELDIKQALIDIQKMDEEHGAFWASIMYEDEYVIETNKNLNLSFIFGDKEIKYKAKDWDEVEHFYVLLLNKKFKEILKKLE